jgi:hypothetical protein
MNPNQSDESAFNEITNEAHDGLVNEYARLARLSALIDRCHEKIEKWVKEGDGADLPRIATLYEKLLRIYDSRMSRLLPCISDEDDLTTVMVTVGQQLQDELGERAPEFMQKLTAKIGEALHWDKAKEFPPAPEIQITFVPDDATEPE